MDVHRSLVYACCNCNVQVRSVTFMAEDCTEDTWSAVYDKLLAADSNATVSIPRPCAASDSVWSREKSWTVTTLTYTPHPDFYGTETILVSLKQWLVVFKGYVPS